MLVPSNLPSDHSSESLGDKHYNYNKIQVVRASPQPRQPAASPPRPSFLPISEPIPVPTQRVAYERISGHFEKSEKQNDEPSSPTKVSA